ncbi:hypothetical protein [Lignipirellula cremea]|uniref:Uncharacterized protein n=1 Tax=Lignipirellula cremea TaxID=2528010 RepID=A0A518DP62_9BACT|nr:hypothetical protein [Lignipirellula cremea]QDU93625.1 hypothetical protein Pla8534_14050 [Lignipirellula cremea]
MRILFVISGVLALVAFLIGFAGSWFAAGASWNERLTAGIMIGGFTFVAALLLGARDHFQRNAVLRKVRRNLLADAATSREEFVALRPFDDVALLLETRTAVAKFFDAPVEQIGRDVHLIRDLHVDQFEPMFTFLVVGSLVSARWSEEQRFGFSTDGLETLDDLTLAIRSALVGLKLKANTANDRPDSR